MYANGAAALTLGYRRVEELLEAQPADLETTHEVIDGSGAPLPPGAFPGVFSLAPPHDPDIVVGLRARADGSVRWLRVKSRPIFDANGNLALTVNVFDDISDRKRVELEGERLLESERAARAEAEASAESLWAISSVTDVALSHLPLDELLEKLLARVRETLSVETATVMLFADDGDNLFLRAASGWDAAEMEDVEIPLRNSVAGRVATTQRPIALEDVGDELPEAILRRSQVVSVADVPLIGDERVLGVLQVGCRKARTFSDRDVGLLQIVADRVSYAIDRSRLFEREHRALERAEFALERLSRLLSVTAALSGAATSSEIAEIVIEQGLAAMGAQAGVLVLIEDSDAQLVLKDHRGYPAEATENWDTIDMARQVPLAQAVREQQLVLLATREDLAKGYPEAGRAFKEHKSFAAIPLISEGRAIGALGLSFDHDNEFSPVERAFMLSLGHQCAQALERARLYEAAQTARAQAESARKRIAFVAEASEILGGSLDYRATLKRVTELAVPRIADLCVIELEEDRGDADLLMLAAMTEEQAKRVRELRRRYPPPRGSGAGPAAVIRNGVPEVVGHSNQEALQLLDPEGDLFARLAARSSLTVPIRWGPQLLGAITFASWDETRTFGHDDVPFAQSLARRAAAAIENARLYKETEESRERFAYLAVTLQRSLLPQQIAEIPGIETAVRYRAAAEGTQVGGDFYDLFPTDERRWALVIGDVCGKGARAAALTGLARHTIRSVAMLGSDPPVILDRLNDAIMREGEDDQSSRFCTVAYATLEKLDRSVKLKVSSGGHPLPLLLHPDGTVEKVGKPGLILGIFEDPEVIEQEIEIRSGDAVLFFTDGVTDSRRNGDIFGDTRLRELLSGCAGKSADEIVDAVEQAVTGFSEEGTSDDIAIMALRVLP